MNHQGTQILETERIILRPFIMDDAEDMFQNWASDSEVTKYLSWTAHKEIQTVRYVLNMWISEYEKPHTYRWGITYKQKGNHVIGSIDVVKMDEHLESAEIGYCISKGYWNQGVTSEALKAVIDYLFSCGFKRIAARHDTKNPASGKVMQKCGMQYEGTLKCGEKNNVGEFCDIALYAAVRN